GAVRKGSAGRDDHDLRRARPEVPALHGCGVDAAERRDVLLPGSSCRPAGQRGTTARRIPEAPLARSFGGPGPCGTAFRTAGRPGAACPFEPLNTVDSSRRMRLLKMNHGGA